MKKKQIIAGLVFVAVIVLAALLLWGRRAGDMADSQYQESKFGAFLAQQHAIYADDFDAAARFSKDLVDVNSDLVQNDRAVSMFLAGKMDDSFAKLSSKTGTSAKAAYAAWRLSNDDWKAVRAIYKNSDSQIMAGMRIWSAVATGNAKEAFAYVKKSGNSESWQLFMNGMIYAETGNNKKAAENFDLVPIEFINLNDYLYMRAFYKKAGFLESYEQLGLDFSVRPGGMFMTDREDDVEWSDFAGYKAALAFSLIQTVSHSPMLSGSTFSVLLLRTAEAVMPADSAALRDALNYYMGNAFFSTNRPRAEEFFAKIGQDSLFVPFAEFRMAESAGSDRAVLRAMNRIIDRNPLFLPAINKNFLIYMRQDRPGRAVRLISRVMDDESISAAGQAMFLNMRARANLIRGKLNNAADDIAKARDISPDDPAIMATAVAVWVRQKKNLEEAYHTALMLIKNYPADLASWDALGQVVNLREGVKEALELYEKVGRVAESNSALFVNLGDIRLAVGDKTGARAAFEKALRLSGDGLSSPREIRRKLKRL